MEEISYKKLQTELADRFLKERHAEFEVSGRRALFADPLISPGGEKTTYSVPTYEALKGICESIYWKPTFYWIVDKVRVINQIQTETAGTKLLNLSNGKCDRAYFTYLCNVKYQVEAHIEWNKNRPQYNEDRDFRKHYYIAARSIVHGGRLPVFLGKTECHGIVKPCVFGEGKGHYDGTGTVNFGVMYHGITYPGQSSDPDMRDQYILDMASTSMTDGVIRFIRPEECIHQKIREGSKTDVFMQ